MSEKPDCEQFRQALEELRRALWLDESRRWWSQFAFHFTDLRNAARILSEGRLYSRTQVVVRHPDFQDSASSAVLGQTSSALKNYVRFYFRPRTPTLFINEGFCPPSTEYPDAHCPVPVYLLFDLEALLCREDSRFTRETLAGYTPGSLLESVDAFRTMPFEDIYHDSRFEPHERDRIVRSRHAELVIPNEIDLTHLRAIWCRSPAEYRTLRASVTPEVWQQWGARITAKSDFNLFFRQRLFVQDASLDHDGIRFTFNIPKRPMLEGQYDIRLQIDDFVHDRHYAQSLQFDYLVSNYVSLGKIGSPDHYAVRLSINGHLAFADTYQAADDIPF
ncbi:MAG: DUF4433 domain-containing protein [Chloroflexi bacterium]|nr:DUF4433 domain-containing protein [Chloroflexota bacterium]